MIFRLSQKLATKLKVGELPALALDDQPLADWSAHLFVADRKKRITGSNAKTAAVLLWPTGPGGPASGAVRFVKALDRSVTGSMNDMIAHAKFWMLERGLSAYEVGFKLNEIPFSSLEYASPRETFKALQG
jgi:hypothetical protein